VEEVGAGEKIDWFVPEIHEANGALVIFALNPLHFHSLPIYLAFLALTLPADPESLQVLFDLILVLQLAALDLHHLLQYLLF
jgi:hypothetical protein